MCVLLEAFSGSLLILHKEDVQAIKSLYEKLVLNRRWSSSDSAPDALMQDIADVTGEVIKAHDGPPWGLRASAHVCIAPLRRTRGEDDVRERSAGRRRRTDRN